MKPLSSVMASAPNDGVSSEGSFSDREKAAEKKLTGIAIKEKDNNGRRIAKIRAR